jgi:hypothetical protein
MRSWSWSVSSAPISTWGVLTMMPISRALDAVMVTANADEVAGTMARKT